MCRIFFSDEHFKFLLCFCRGPPRFEVGDRPRFGDREGYRGGPPRGPDGFGDKGGAPEGFQPSFRVYHHTIDR